jgi:hypothetical protein
MRILVAVPPGAEKPPTLPPAAKSLAGDDQRHRIVRDGMIDIARSFRSGTEFLRQSAISGRAAPSDLPRRGINTLERSLIEALAGCYLGRRQVVLAERHYRARLRPFGTFRFKS